MSYRHDKRTYSWQWFGAVMIIFIGAIALTMGMALLALNMVARDYEPVEAGGTSCLEVVESHSAPDNLQPTLRADQVQGVNQYEC